MRLNPRRKARNTRSPAHYAADGKLGATANKEGWCTLVTVLDHDPVLRRDAGMVLAAGHAGLVVLGLIGRLEYADHATSVTVGTLADASVWVPLHGIACLAIVFTHLFHWREHLATGLSTALFAVWSILNLLWATEVDGGVSYVPPILGATLAGLAWVLTRSWEEHRNDRSV